jgi:hypothetical protein
MSNNRNSDIENRIISAKKLSLFFLSVLICSIISSVYFYTELINKNGEIEKTNHKLELQKKELEVKNKELELQKNLFEMQKDKIALLNDRLTQLLAQNQNSSPNTEKLIRLSENSKYSVAIYGYSINNELFNKVGQYFSDEGYTVLTASVLQKRTSWLSLQSTVFYYDKSSVEKAKLLADTLKRITDNEFKVARGAGLGVIEVKGQEKWSFRVHFIGD